MYNCYGLGNKQLTYPWSISMLSSLLSLSFPPMRVCPHLLAMRVISQSTSFGLCQVNPFYSIKFNKLKLKLLRVIRRPTRIIKCIILNIAIT